MDSSNLGAGRPRSRSRRATTIPVRFSTTATRSAGVENDYGELGQGNTETLGDEGGEAPLQIAAHRLRAGRKAIEIAAGQEFTCAKLDDNSVKCWGRNTYGQLGQGNTTTLGVTAGQVAAAPAIALGAGLSVEQLTVAHITRVLCCATPRAPATRSAGATITGASLARAIRSIGATTRARWATL